MSGHVPACPGPSDHCGYCGGMCIVGEACMSACLAQAKGSWVKARRLYMKHMRWRDADWYRAWPQGLADACVDAAAHGRRGP